MHCDQLFVTLNNRQSWHSSGPSMGAYRGKLGFVKGTESKGGFDRDQGLSPGRDRFRRFCSWTRLKGKGQEYPCQTLNRRFNLCRLGMDANAPIQRWLHKIVDFQKRASFWFQPGNTSCWGLAQLSLTQFFFNTAQEQQSWRFSIRKHDVKTKIKRRSEEMRFLGKKKKAQLKTWYAENERIDPWN